MGLFKSISGAVKKAVTVVRKPVAAVLGGHAMTGVIARVAPKVLGIKSAGAKGVVDVTQKALLAGGAAALTGGAMKSILPSGPTGSAAVTPATPGPVNAYQEAIQERLIQHILKG